MEHEPHDLLVSLSPPPAVSRPHAMIALDRATLLRVPGPAVCQWSKADMDWRKHTTAEHYSLILGICQAEVWQAHGVWTAIVGREGSTMQQDHFSTLHDAQTWCEQRIAGLHCLDTPLRDA